MSLADIIKNTPATLASIKKNGCSICKKKTHYQSIWIMSDYEMWVCGAPANKRRVIYYNLCREHSKDLKKSSEMIEKSVYESCLKGDAKVVNVGDVPSHGVKDKNGVFGFNEIKGVIKL